MTDTAAPHGDCVLGREDIKHGRESGALVIEPFDERHLTNCAYEVTLSPDAIFVPVVNFGQVVDVTSKEQIRNSWSLVDRDKPNPATSPNPAGITIPSKGMVLVASHEFVGTTPSSSTTTLLRARSTMARAGLSISASAGWGDVGFYSRWGLLIANHSYSPIYIPFGTRVAQVAFLRVSGLPKEGHDYASLTGAYALAKTDDLTFASLRDAWTPDCILPRG